MRLWEFTGRRETQAEPATPSLPKGEPWPDGHVKSAYRGPGAHPVISVISVSRPLDYEQIPNGLIYLTIMAKDAGNPPLNSTVSVTIEVFVSTQGCTGLAILGNGVVSVPPRVLEPC